MWMFLDRPPGRSSKGMHSSVAPNKKVRNAGNPVTTFTRRTEHVVDAKRVAVGFLDATSNSSGRS